LFSFAWMKLRDIERKFVNQLAIRYDEDEAKAIFFLAIEHHLNISRSNYLLRNNEEISIKNLEQFESILHQLKAGRPIQYILGKTVFYGLPFNVNEAVLIPRPETEELVAWVLEKVESLKLKVESSEPASGNPQPVMLLDIGTGSGCIAISLKKNLPQFDVSALDISSEALTVAKNNAILNEVEIDFNEDNILSNPVSILNTQYSILVSNPPYITESEKNQMQENVLANEPHLALFVSNDRPLIFYEAIAEFALKNLRENGLLFFEINELLGEATVDMLANKGFTTIELRKDMQGKDRMICCSKN
jgi:release factor glutamine methyltransferase